MAEIVPIQDKSAPKAAPETQEIATVARDWTYPAFMGVLINRDDTLLQRGQSKGLKLYDEIERDARAYSALQKRKLAVIARPWDVLPASDAAPDKAAAEGVKAILQMISFDQLTVDLLDALLKGFSVGEIMWAVKGNLLVVDRIIARDQRRFIFDDQYQLRMLVRENLLRGVELPERKFIVHSFGAKDASPYGLGLGNKLFWPVFFKRQDITFWLTFADKFGSPTAVGKYPPGSSGKDQQKLLDALAAIAQDSGVIVPEGMLIELLEAARTGSIDTYEKLARYMDEQIVEAVLGETGATSARGSGLGGGGQAKVQNDNEVRLELVKADADLLSGTLNRTLIRWLSEYNFPDAQPPCVWRQVEEPKDLDAQATRDASIFTMGFKPTLKYITDTYGGDWTEKPDPPPPDPRALGAPPNRGAAEYAEARRVALSPAQAAIERAGLAFSDATLQGQMERTLAPVMELVKSGAGYEDIMGKLAETFPKMDNSGLEEMLARAIFVGDLWGHATAETSPAAFAESAEPATWKSVIARFIEAVKKS